MPEAATDGFEAAAAPYRRELLAHCYRMTGSVHEAEDLVQETYVRAWRAFDRFERRSSVRTWLYRIATNVCLTALDRRRRRPLPSGLVPPSPDPYAPAEPAPGDVPWLEPVPDRLVVDKRGDPAEVMAVRHSVRLALVAGLQVLPPRQRAAFIVCDVLGVSAADAAELLDVSIVAVKSLLQRARARLADVSLTDGDLAEPTDARARRLLDRYVAAFERSDIAAIERLLADDAVLEMTGTTTWFSGKARACRLSPHRPSAGPTTGGSCPSSPTASWPLRLTAGTATARTTRSPSSCWPPPRRTSPASHCSPTLSSFPTSTCRPRRQRCVETGGGAGEEAAAVRDVGHTTTILDEGGPEIGGMRGRGSDASGVLLAPGRHLIPDPARSSAVSPTFSVTHASSS